MNALCDELLVTWYPISADFGVLIGGSQALQADFVGACFKAKDRHAERIPHIEWFAPHDFSPAQLVALQEYYGGVNARFAAYLGSIGQRTYAGPGEDKAAWARLLAEMAARRG